MTPGGRLPGLGLALKASRVACLAAMLASFGAAAVPTLATDTGTGVPVLEEGATPTAQATLEDRDFGVRTRALGLDRQVEMYQWRAAGDGYEAVWNSALIDSSGFDDAHRNPPMPLDTQRWWAKDATLAGYPVDVEVLRALGEWRTFRPGFSRLPLNMAATFQPDGDGLGSAENPLHPQVGDLRIRWRELVLPPLQGRVAFRDGAWRLRRSAAPGTRPPGGATAATIDAANPSSPPEPAAWNWTWALVGLAALVVLLLLRWRRKR